MDVESIFRTVSLVHYCQLGATFTALYDHICTLDVEIEYIWKQKWTLSKALFVAIRYFGELVLILECVLFLNEDPSQRFCFWGFTFMPVGSSILIWLCQTILQLRIHALYHGSIKVKIFLGILFLAQVAAMIQATVSTQMVFKVIAEPSPGVHVCAVLDTPKHIWIYWMAVVVFETILFLMAVGIMIKNYWMMRIVRTYAVGDKPSLLHIMLRDSAVYFFVAFAAYTATTVMWLKYPSIHPELSACFSQMSTTILGCRLILSLSEAHYSAETVSVWNSQEISQYLDSFRWRGRYSMGTSATDAYSLGAFANPASNAGEQNETSTCITMK